MAKRKPQIKMRSYGVYTKWDSGSKNLPRLSDVTTKVRAEIDVEFGFVVNIKGGKNLQLEYCIDHPGILDDHGNRREPFVGSVYIKSNDWDFYLGDTIWEPIEDKLGTWRMTLTLAESVVADQSFELFL